MDQFTVPQFIDREPKIIGPITVRQFIIMLIGFGLGFLAYKFSDFSLFIVFAILIALVFGSIAFIKINGRPFHYFIIALISTKKRPSVRVWKKDYKKHTPKPKNKSKELSPDEKKKAEAKAQKQQLQKSLAKKRLASSRLSKLSLTVDTGGKYRDDKK